MAGHLENIGRLLNVVINLGHTSVGPQKDRHLDVVKAMTRLEDVNMSFHPTVDRQSARVIIKMTMSRFILVCLLATLAQMLSLPTSEW